MSRFELPAIGDPSAVAFPAIDRRSLANAMRVWSVQQSAVPAATIVCVLDGGTAGDPADRPGLASLTAALVTEGAGVRDAIAIADVLARIGGQLEVEAGVDVTSVSLTVLSKHFETGLALLADIIRRPRLEAGDFARVRELRLNRLKQVSLMPGAAADRALLAAVFGDHPYGHGALGTTRAIEAATLDDVRGFWAAGWRPACTTLLVAGDVDATRVHAGAAAVFADWSGRGGPAAPVPVPVARPARDLLVVHRPGAPQSELRVGHVGPARKTPDYHALVTLNALLGGQFTSRINRNLREGRAITYGARSSFDMRRAGGLFACDTSVQADATAVAIAEVLRELGDVSKDGAITPAELEQARASLTRGYVRHFETAVQLARAMVQLVAYDLDADTFDRFVPAVNGLPLEALTRAARATLHPADSAIVVVGDLEQHGKSLEALGREVTETRPEF